MEDKSRPYEIRKELLHLAKSILSENTHVRSEFNRLYPKDGETSPKEPTTYTTEDVIREAEKLSAFVSKKT